MNKQMQVGLGEAIRRVNTLSSRKSRGILSTTESEEYDLLMSALDNIKIDLGFDCDGDGIPDSIEIFTATAKTSCCRLIDLGELPKPKKRRTSSRRKK
jgi:hypothetical protein